MWQHTAPATRQTPPIPGRSGNWLAALILCLMGAGAIAQDEIRMQGVSPELLKPFQALRRPLGPDRDAGGAVDWGNRMLVGIGKAAQKGNGGQSKLMAMAEAKTIALRNAVALAGGIEIGADGTVKGLAQGSLDISAQVTGAAVESYSAVSGPDGVHWLAEVRVPLLGVRSLSVTTYDLARKAHRRMVSGLPRLYPDSAALDPPPADGLLVVDARGSGLRPSLYPVLLGARNEVVLDIESIAKERAIQYGLCAFATTTLSPDALEAGPALALVAPPPTEPGYEGFDGPVPSGIPAWLAGDLLPQRIVVEGAEALGPNRSALRLSEPATERLRNDRRAASLLYGGKVMVIVDAPATGIEGRLPWGLGLAGRGTP